MKRASIWQKMIACFRAFVRNESGMTLPMMGLALVAMTGFSGSALDLARMELVQSKLSYSLDAAGLAAGTTANTVNVTTEVTKYMQANFPAGFLGASIPGVTVTSSANNTIFNLTASTTIPTTFMNIFGIASLTVHATSQITRQVSGLELVMALDNTGSMASSNKLTALKAAATTMVNDLYGGKSTVNNLWIGLVPFSQAVNIGTDHAAWTDTAYTAAFDWGTTSWGGCVDAREANNRDVTDDPPSVALFNAYYWTSDSNNTWKTTSRKGKIKYASPLDTTNQGPNLYCPQTVTPMTANKNTTLNAINAMVAQGNTHIDLGIAWAWRMISPRWRGLWGGEMNAAALPLDYHTRNMNKAVILLTDGENTIDNSSHGAYWYLSDGHLGTTNSTNAVTQLDTRMTSVCTSLKAQGVYVYTIALGSPGANIQTLLKNCATAQNYYFNSPTAAQLDGIFSAIADSLSNLRVSQ